MITINFFFYHLPADPPPPPKKKNIACCPQKIILKSNFSVKGIVVTQHIHHFAFPSELLLVTYYLENFFSTKKMPLVDHVQKIKSGMQEMFTVQILTTLKYFSLHSSVEVIIKYFESTKNVLKNICYTENFSCKKHILTFNNRYDSRQQKHITWSLFELSCILAILYHIAGHFLYVHHSTGESSGNPCCFITQVNLNFLNSFQKDSKFCHAFL